MNDRKNEIGYWKRRLMEDLNTPEDIIPLANEMIEDLLNPSWSFKFKSMERTLGLCNYNRRTIFLSSEYVRDYFAAAREDVIGTILHEFAHTMEFIQYGRIQGRGHGDRWRHNCWLLGIPGETKNRKLDPALNRSYRWAVVVDGTNEFVRGYYRKPRLDYSKRYIIGRMETAGKLKVVPFSHFHAMA